MFRNGWSAQDFKQPQLMTHSTRASICEVPYHPSVMQIKQHAQQKAFDIHVHSQIDESSLRPGSLRAAGWQHLMFNFCLQRKESVNSCCRRRCSTFMVSPIESSAFHAKLLIIYETPASPDRRAAREAQGAARHAGCRRARSLSQRPQAHRSHRATGAVHS